MQAKIPGTFHPTSQEISCIKQKLKQVLNWKIGRYQDPGKIPRVIQYQTRVKWYINVY